MTDKLPGWRTVATHGAPTTADVPVLVRTVYGARFLHDGTGTPLTKPRTRWIPLAELDSLPDAPPPARTVTIEVSADDARDVMESDWNENMTSGRIAAAVKAALEADEATP